MVERLFILKTVCHAGTAGFEGNYTLTRIVEFPPGCLQSFSGSWSVMGALWGYGVYR